MSGERRPGRAGRPNLYGKRARVTVLMPPALAGELAALAAGQTRSRNEAIVAACRAYVRAARRRKDRGGVMSRTVYLLFCADRYKIGVSHDSQGRAMTVSPGAAVVHEIESARPFLIERALHQRFHGRRLGGEWFALTPHEAALVRGVERADRVEDLPSALRVVVADSVEVRVEVSRELASSLEYAAAALGYSVEELAALVLRAHVGEYRRLADEVRRVRGGE